MTTPINLTDPIFHNEDAARKYFEALHWPSGPVCTACGVVNEATELKGEAHRAGVWKCRACEEQFTVTVGTVMESSHIPLHKWALAFRLMAGSKKGVSAHQLMRELGLGSYRTAWFLAHRVREAMTDGNPTPLGGKGQTVEADETYMGPSESTFVTGKGWQEKRGFSAKKRKILTMVERKGRARSIKAEELNLETVKKIVVENVDKDSTLNTDEAAWYKKIGKEFAEHATVTHSDKEYSRRDGEKTTTTNTVESYFSLFKRGMHGIYQHCGEQHLQAYLNEFDFRYSNRVALGVDDTERAARAISGARGKRLMYQRPRKARAG
jgi:transposase-like protein